MLHALVPCGSDWGGQEYDILIQISKTSTSLSIRFSNCDCHSTSLIEPGHPFFHVNMSATSLSLEIQQQSFSLLDSKSFHATRRVCRWWRFASIESNTLSHQLRKLPIRPTLDKTNSNPLELEQLFNKAAYDLLFHVRISKKPEANYAFQSACQLPFMPKMASSQDGAKVVTLNDQSIALFEKSGGTPVVVLQRQLSRPKDHSEADQWSKVTAISQHELALSSNSQFLAVGLDRTVQVYDLSGPEESETVDKYIHDACSRHITGLAFGQEDRTVRVCLSGNGVALYLGSPLDHAGATPSMSRWRSDKGLRHTFLDSSLLASRSKISSKVHFSGLQLLRPFSNGYLFGAQRHGGGESSRYVLGHVRCSLENNGTIPIAERDSVTELASLESFLSSWNLPLNTLKGNRMGNWEDMPSAHEHHCRYAMAGDLLVLAERDKKSVRPNPKWTQLFLYRVPIEEPMLEILGNDGCLLAKTVDTVTTAMDQKEMATRAKRAVARIQFALTHFPERSRTSKLRNPTWTDGQRTSSKS